MQLEAQLVHAETGKRVVQVRAMAKDQCLGSALGEAPTAEEAEDRARSRLLARLGIQPESNPSHSARTEQQEPPTKAEKAPKAAPIPYQPSAAEPPPEPATPPAAELGEIEVKLPLFDHLELPSQEVPGREPEDWSSELTRLDLQLQRLGWSREEEAIYLERAFSHPSRNRLTSYADIVCYLKSLEALNPGANPGSAPVPLRRKDLLNQCDQLLGQLQWDASRGRTFLEQHFSLSSRQQLNDTQLLQFNMLLEGELMGI